MLIYSCLLQVVPHKKMEPTYLNMFSNESNEEEIRKIKRIFWMKYDDEIFRKLSWNVVVLVPTYDSYHCPHMNVCNFRFIACYCSHSITVFMFVACLSLIHCEFNNIFKSIIRFLILKYFLHIRLCFMHASIVCVCIDNWYGTLCNGQTVPNVQAANVVSVECETRISAKLWKIIPVGY